MPKQTQSKQQTIESKRFSEKKNHQRVNSKINKDTYNKIEQNYGLSELRGWRRQRDSSSANKTLGPLPSCKLAVPYGLEHVYELDNGQRLTDDDTTKRRGQQVDTFMKQQEQSSSSSLSVSGSSVSNIKREPKAGDLRRCLTKQKLQQQPQQPPQLPNELVNYNQIKFRATQGCHNKYDPMNQHKSSPSSSQFHGLKLSSCNRSTLSVAEQAKGATTMMSSKLTSSSSQYHCRIASAAKKNHNVNRLAEFMVLASVLLATAATSVLLSPAIILAEADTQSEPTISTAAQTTTHISGDQSPWVPNEAAGSRLAQEDQRLLKKAGSMDHISSADLPAEFRGLDNDDLTLDGGNSPSPTSSDGQSKLAKLCQQTSSVLASVLPAPFGGHKRSILCQFFGQVPMQQQPQTRAPVKSAAAINQQQQQHLMPSYQEAGSIAVIHQPQQPPITLLTSGRHPIQMVVEQHQRQLMLAQQQQQQRQIPLASPVQLPVISAGTRQQQSDFAVPILQDLKSSASVMDYAYSQRVEAPASMRRPGPNNKSKLAAAEPATSGFKPLAIGSSIAPPVSTSGWRIFNHSALTEVAASSPQVEQVDSTAKQQAQASGSKPRPPAGRGSTASSTAATAEKAAADKVKNLPISGSSRKTVTLQVDKQRPASNSTAKVNSSATAANHSSPVSSLDQKQILLLGKPPGFSDKSHKNPPQVADSSDRATGNNIHSASSMTSTTLAAPTTNRQQAAVSKRSEALKSTTRSIANSDASFSTTTINDDRSHPQQPQAEVRTIEVTAQASGSSNPTETSGQFAASRRPSSSLTSQMTTTSTSTSTTTERPASPLSADLHQVQKREELVIASINNLTRIAFGNQLRDTVKVINKLIDKQAELFNANGGRHQQTGKQPDYLSTAASSVKNSIKLSPVGGSSTNKPAAGKMQQVAKQPLDKTKPNKLQRQKQAATSTTRPITQQPQKLTKKPKKQVTGRGGFTAQPLSSTSGRKFDFQKLSTQSNAVKPSADTQARARSIPKASASGASSSSGDTQRRSPQTAAVSRSLALEPLRYTEPLQAATTVDISRRERPTVWQSTRTAPVANNLRATEAPLALSTKWRGHQQQAASGSSVSYSWLVPDKSAIRPWTTRKDSGGATSGQLVLNRIDSSPIYEKQQTPMKSGRLVDSLTTLKMSLLPSTSTTTTTTTTQAPPVTATSSQVAPTTGSSLIQSMSPVQSRWIPTLTISPVMQATNNPTTTRLSSSTTLTSENSPERPTTLSIQNTPISSRKREVIDPTTTTTTTTAKAITVKEAPTLSDLNEAKASDSISRYTTHWNDANELLSTTRRLFQQPQPQIAQTGEFFNAETIASWPEQYQTRIGQAMDNSLQLTSSTRSMFPTSTGDDTTRRNGESYSEQQTTTSNALARHRMDTGSGLAGSEQRTTAFDTLAAMMNMSSITILPPNHKLLSTSLADQPTTNALDNEGATTLNLRESTSRPLVDLRHTVPAPMAAYTLVGPYSETTGPHFEMLTEAEAATAELRATTKQFPQLLPDTNSLLQLSNEYGQLNNNHSTNNSNLNNPQLRPPYLPLEDDRKSSAGFMFGQMQRPTNVTRKLYELLVPSSRSFVGPQNPMNQQRFNLSALKFLAQNLLSPTSAAATEQHDDTKVAQLESEYLANMLRGDNSSTGSSQQYLMDQLLSGSLNPSSYYDLPVNSSGSNGSNKTVLARASNLLNDLKQLEHKKAAAILAAIRYQVPSPLVRPWDLVSDNNPSSSQMNDRLDDVTGSGEHYSDYLLTDLLAQAARRAALRASLAKQRLVPRDELEARLNGSKLLSLFSTNHNEDDADSGMERRSDSVDRSSAAKFSYSIGDSSTRHDDAYYVSPNSTGKQAASRYGDQNKSWLNRLLGMGSWHNHNRSTDTSNQTSADVIYDLKDIETTKLPLREENHEANNQQHSKYIKSTGYKFTNEMNQGTRTTMSQSLPRHHMPSSAAKLRENLDRLRATTSAESTDYSPEDADQTLRVKQKDDQTEQKDFDCTNKAAGFHPDPGSTCQTFYHCSNTGHLLTFNCPQQTRFDEKSLKCGPWFEVPCDLARGKQQPKRRPL